MKEIADFTVGDVVHFDDETTLGIVTVVGARSLQIVFSHGGRAAGPGLLACVLHREPRVRASVPAGALGSRGWNREQAVKAALRRAGL